MLPNAPEAERTVIASLLRENNQIDDVARILPNSEYFYSDVNQRVYRGILALHSRNEPADFLTVPDWLHSTGIIENTDLEYLAQMMIDFPIGTGSVNYYAEIIQKKALSRKLINLCTELIRDTHNQMGTPEELIERAERELGSLSNQKANDGILTLSEYMTQAVQHYEAIATSNGMKGGFPYGFADLDRDTGGLHAGELVILAARPSVGKTAYSLAVAANVVVESQVPVYIASLEQSGIELASRFICMFSEIDSSRWRMGKLYHEEMDRFCMTRHELEQMEIYVSDRAQNLNAIIANSRRLKLKKNIGLMILDYIQLCETEDRRTQRYEQVGEISRRLKLLTRELEIPILALAQLGRATDDRPNGEPELSDLRESGNLEADADTVLMMYRPKDALTPHAQVQKINVKIGKQRNGPVGTVSLAFRKNQLKFENYAEYPNASMADTKY